MSFDEERLSQEFEQCMSQEPVLETCIMISSDSEDDFVAAKKKTTAGSKKKTVLESSDDDAAAAAAATTTAEAKGRNIKRTLIETDSESESDTDSDKPVRKVNKRKRSALSSDEDNEENRDSETVDELRSKINDLENKLKNAEARNVIWLWKKLTEPEMSPNQALTLYREEVGFGSDSAKDHSIYCYKEFSTVYVGLSSQENIQKRWRRHYAGSEMDKGCSEKKRKYFKQIMQEKGEEYTGKHFFGVLTRLSKSEAMGIECGLIHCNFFSEETNALNDDSAHPPECTHLKLLCQRLWRLILADKISDKDFQDDFMDELPFKYDFKCNICDVALPSKLALNKHRLSAHGKTFQRYSCTICKAIFANKSNAKRHQEVWIFYTKLSTYFSACAWNLR